MARSQLCASCRVPHYCDDLIGPFCGTCYRRLGPAFRTGHVTQHCERCGARFSTSHDRAVCVQCAAVPARWRLTLRVCRGCGWLYRSTRRGITSCERGCRSRNLRDQRMAAARRIGTHTAQEWQDTLAEHDHRCAYCGSDDPLTKDHVRPVARGGSDLIENIVPACRPCNSAKQTKPLHLWLDARSRKIDENSDGQTTA